MVRFYVGNTLESIAARILNAIPKDGTGRHVILVPDRFTLAVEERIAREVGATINIDVLTFARLSERYLGPVARQCLTPEGCTMLLTKAMYHARDRLTYYRRACEVEGFANEMYSSLVAMRASGINPEDLYRAGARMTGHGRTKDKTEDLAIIMEAYLHELGSEVDPTTRLERLAEAIPHSADIADTDFYVIDFYCFNPVQYRVLKALMCYAHSVHVGYVEPSSEADRRFFPKDLRDKLLRCAGEASVMCDTVVVPSPLNDTQRRIESMLFDYADAAVSADPPDPNSEEYALPTVSTGSPMVQLFRAGDATDELRQVCAEIRELLRTEHYRYRDVAIVCAQSQAYDEVFRAVFDEYGIPLFRDTKVLLSDEPFVRFVLDLLEAERQNFAFESVLKVVKNAFFAAKPSDVDYFENYCRKYNIDYTRFYEEFTLEDKEHHDDLARAEKVRARLNGARIDVLGCAKVTDYIAAIRRFLADYDVDTKFRKFCMRQMEMGCDEAAERSRQVPARFRGLLDLADRLLGQEEVNLAQFIMLLRSSLESVHISLLPQSADCVYVGEAKDSRYDKVKALFVVGAADGVLPQTPQAGSILSDAYYAALQNQNLVIYPSAKEEGRNAMFYLEQLLLLPSERLYVSFCARGKDNTRLYGSSLVTSLAGICGIRVQDGLTQSSGVRIANRANAYKVLLRRRAQMSDADVRLLYDRLSPEDQTRYDNVMGRADTASLDTLAGDLFIGRDQTSISQLETYFQCPYMHYVKYGLRATEREENLLDVRETGTLLHGVLELFFRRNYDRIDTLTTADVDAEVDACLDQLMSTPRFMGLSASERQVQLARLNKESHIVVSREVTMAQRSLFKPAEFEVAFGDDGKYPPIDLRNGVRLRGKIDRIDRCDAEVLIIDYKTGSVSVNLEDVYFGTKVQLYAYLGALQKAGFIPVGAFYKHISAAYVREDADTGSAQSLLGFPPADEQQLLRIDPTLRTEDSSTIVSVKRTEKGFTRTGQGGQPIDAQELQAIIDYVLALMQGAVAEILDGYIEAKPLPNVCTYCKAQDMCPNAAHSERCKPSVDLQSFGEDDDE